MKTKIILALLFITTISHAQLLSPSRKVVTRHMVWGGFYGEYKFSPALSATLDAQGRYDYQNSEWYQWLVRAGAWYKAKNGLIFGAGVARFNLYANPDTKPARPEWRPWQEVGFKIRFGHSIIYPRFRFEQRYIRDYNHNDLADTFDLNTFRERFRIDYNYRFRIDSEKGFSIIESQEVLIATKKTGFTALDAARWSLGIGYAFNKFLSLQLAYFYELQQKDSKHFEEHEVARFTLQLQLAKREKKPVGESGK